MKVLCFSDLHLDFDAVTTESIVLSSVARQIKIIAEENNPDVIAVTGDIICSRNLDRIFLLLNTMFSTEIPIIATLGNHEFWFRSFEETLESLRIQKNKAASNIHFLDIDGSFQTQGLNFVGGCLFFDGSMRVRENQKITPWNGWNDYLIRDIEQCYLEFNRYYVELIKSNMKPGMSTVLCTHHVPHWKLNGHAPSHYSFYTGMRDLIRQLPFDYTYDNYLICGHTHCRVIGEVIPNFMCVNVGSDYDKLEYYLLEI